MYKELEDINNKPEVYCSYSPEDLWNDSHISRMLLDCHLNRKIDMASRKHDFIDKSVEWLNSTFTLKSKKVCDFGCGPGLYTSRIANYGAKVTGIDISENSIKYAIDYADKNSLNINYIRDDYLSWESDEKFDLILMIYCDFCALDPNQRSIMLNKFKNLLTKKGHIVLDVYSEASFNYVVECSYYERDMHNGFWSDKPYFGFTNSFKYEKEKITLDRYTIVEKNRTRSLYNWLQYYSVDRLKDEFKNNGLKIKYIYSDVKGSIYNKNNKEIAVVAAQY